MSIIEKELEEIEKSIEKKYINCFKNYQADSEGINETLRNVKPGDKITGDIYEIIKCIKEGINSVSKKRLRKDFIVYRGFGLESVDILINKTTLNSKEITYMNNYFFLSTSIDDYRAEKFADCCVFEVLVPYKERLSYVYLSNYGEKEVLFDYPTYFEVINKKEKDDKQYYECILRKGRIVIDSNNEAKVIKNDVELLEEVLDDLEENITKSIHEYKEAFGDEFDKEEDFKNKKYGIKLYIKQRYKDENLYNKYEQEINDFLNNIYNSK